jgi:hypothetical protein
MFLESIILVLIVIVLIQNLLFYFERQKMIDKIMAGSFDKYQIYSKKPEENELSKEEDENLIPLDQAREFILEDAS